MGMSTERAQILQDTTLLVLRLGSNYGYCCAFFLQRAVAETLGCDLPLFVSQKLMTGFRLQLAVKISNMRFRVRSFLVRACRTQ